MVTLADAVLVSPPPPRSVALAPVDCPVELGAAETVGSPDATVAICAIWGADGEDAEDGDEEDWEDEEDCVVGVVGVVGTTTFCCCVWVRSETPGACDAL